MSESLAAGEPYTTRFEATVDAIDGRDVELSSTYFYPESGGQPADTGRLRDHRVVDVQSREDGTVVHTLAEPPTFGVGATVLGHIDRARRLYCMRAHTASHVVYGAARRCMDDLGYGGFGISVRPRTPAGATTSEGDDREPATAPADGDGRDKVRVDFLTSTDVDDDVLVELESLANRTVWESRDVDWAVMPETEARALDGIAFNDKTEEGVFGVDESVRVVTVGGAAVAAGEPAGETWDVAACGGTHVRNTREIGAVSVLERSNPGEGMTRVEFAVGPAAIEQRAADKRALLAASRALGTSTSEVPDAIRRLQGDVESLREKVDSLQRGVLADRVDSAASAQTDGEDAVVADLAAVDVDANDVEAVARDAAGDRANVVVLVGEDGGTFVVVAASADASVDADAVVDDVTDAFGGGGGGSPTFAQGGGVDAESDEIVNWLRD
jgi:alanyl-tRNA synthetase